MTKTQNEFAASESYVSESNSDEHMIHGIALSADDVLRSRSMFGGMDYLRFSRESLMEAAPTLEGQPLVLDHENRSVRDSVGEITKAKYEDGDIKYKARMVSVEEELLERVKAGLFEVSIRAFHRPISTLEYDGDTGQHIINQTEFDNLSIVTKGEAQSNTLNYGDTQLDNISTPEEFGEEATVIAASISEPEIVDQLESQRVTQAQKEQFDESRKDEIADTEAKEEVDADDVSEMQGMDTLFHTPNKAKFN